MDGWGEEDNREGKGRRQTCWKRKEARVYRSQVRWSEDGGTETRGSEGKDKRGERY